jgi:hypothetical protein
MQKSHSESRLRKMAAKEGYAIRKSRIRTPHIDNQGEYMLVDTRSNICVLGSRFDADLADIGEFLGD